MQRRDTEQNTQGDQSFFAQLPAVLLAGAAIVAILVVNQPQPAADNAAVPAAEPIESLIPAGTGKMPAKAVAGTSASV